VGLVRDGNKAEIPDKDKLLPWILRAGEKLVKFEDRIMWIPVERDAAVAGDSRVLIKGTGWWTDGRSQGLCSPSTATFRVAKANTYLVEIVWKDPASCSMRISDISVTAQPNVVESEPACTRGR
jgi:hypothetical protein